MTELEIFENITQVRCAVCNDKLTDWEIGVCVFCETEMEVD